MKSLPKLVARFFWRLARNILFLVGLGRILTSSGHRAEAFGRADAAYAWGLFRHHLGLLEEAGFHQATRVLEVGPGQNLGTSLLWWSLLTDRHPAGDVVVTPWDVLPNADIADPHFWKNVARSLLAAKPDAASHLWVEAVCGKLECVADGRRPTIEYRVAPLTTLLGAVNEGSFDLVYSHAALEHAWRMDRLWEALARLSAPDAWHSHRIDLADHGLRETNYIAFLQWPAILYWLTMRFVPGATNRWRPSHHLAKLRDLGFSIIIDRRISEPVLPVPLSFVRPQFRKLGSDELRVIGLDLVMRARWDRTRRSA